MEKHNYAILSDRQSEALRKNFLTLLQNFLENPSDIEIYDTDSEGGHYHRYWEIRFVRRYQSENFEKFILIPPNVKHLSIQTRVYDKSFLMQLRSGYLEGVFYNHSVVNLRQNNPKFDILIKVCILLTNLKKAGLSNSFLIYYTKALVMHLIDLFNEKWGVPPPAKGNSFNQANSYLMENIQNPEFSVVDIAKYLGVNPYYISKLFIKNTGVSAQRYLILVRLSAACELLIDGCFAIGDIAHLTGWKNHTYFSRRFKSVLGITPHEFYSSSLIKQKQLKQKLDNIVVSYYAST